MINNNAAVAAAEHINHNLTHRHRGVLDCDDKLIIYGNDAYESDERSQEEVDLMRRELVELDLPISEFGVSRNGHTWAMVVDLDEHRSVEHAEIEHRLWTCWKQACGIEPVGV